MMVDESFGTLVTRLKEHKSMGRTFLASWAGPGPGR